MVVSNGQMVTYTFRNMLFWYFSFRLLRSLDSIELGKSIWACVIYFLVYDTVPNTLLVYDTCQILFFTVFDTCPNTITL
jgi:hypothetical protein